MCYVCVGGGGGKGSNYHRNLKTKFTIEKCELLTLQSHSDLV